MLAKLMKYEFKATSRIFIPLYAVLLVFSIVNRIINPDNLIRSSSNFDIFDIFAIVGVTLYIGMIIAVVIVTLIIMIQRYYKNLLGDEGYLMFTLPVQSWKLIISKVITSVTWSILSFLTTIVSLIIIMGTKNLGTDIREIFEFIKTSMGAAGFVILPLYGLLMLASSIIMIFTAITLGQLFSKHRVIASFGMYCALYMAQQLLLSILILSFSFSWFQFIIRSTDPTPTQLNKFLIFIIIPGIIMGIVHFIVTNYIMNRKLNLE